MTFHHLYLYNHIGCWNDNALILINIQLIGMAKRSLSTCIILWNVNRTASWLELIPLITACFLTFIFYIQWDTQYHLTGSKSVSLKGNLQQTLHNPELDTRDAHKSFFPNPSQVSSPEAARPSQISYGCNECYIISCHSVCLERFIYIWGIQSMYCVLSLLLYLSVLSISVD